jgi:hypothetical protein
MKIKLKEPITTGSGVTYPTGYVFEVDNLTNLTNGVTIAGVISEPRPGLLVCDEVFRIGIRDLHKVEVTLDIKD